MDSLSGNRKKNVDQSPESLLHVRRRRLQQIIGRTLSDPVSGASAPLSSDGMAYLLEELQELYWNDLEWENVTEEERMEGGGLPELTFPGVLAMVRGLLLTEVAPDALAQAEPRPEVVAAFLDFLADRIRELSDEAAGAPGDDGDRAALDLRMTEALLDRVLMQYHQLSPEEVGSLD
jgi:hypothetical protein